MRKSRISSAGRKDIRPDEVKSSHFLRSFGLSVSGGKSDKTCLAVLDQYFDSNKKPHRLFLSAIHDKIQSEDFVSADMKISEIISQLLDNAKIIVLDAPMTLPKCLRCELDCPGFETCQVEEIKWMRTFYQSLPKKKNKKLFTPYTQRPIDLYLSELEEENLEVQHSLGANLAPLTARSIFLSRRMPIDCIETFPKLAVWRLGLDLKVAKSQLRKYRSSVGGEDARRIFLQALIDKTGLFLYNQDFRLLCENHHAFESLICAYIGTLYLDGKTEKRPEGFPKNEAWVEFPTNKTVK